MAEERTNEPSVGDWDLDALQQLPPAEQLDYITDRLAADFKNKTANVGTAILMLRNLADELRERDAGSSSGQKGGGTAITIHPAPPREVVRYVPVPYPDRRMLR